MNIGIIVAMEEELNEVIKEMEEVIEINYNNVIFYKGYMNKNECVLVKSGIGKVNAARTTQILIDRFNIMQIINVGAAGGINEKLNIADIVIAEKLVQYDFDISAFGREKGFITGVGKYIDSNKELVKKCDHKMKEINKDKNFNVIIGTIASGDKFCTDYNETKKIREEFEADCVEMEGAAIAQVCYLENVPFIVIRSISDTPNGNNNIEFDKYVSIASKRCAVFLKKLLE